MGHGQPPNLKMDMLMTENDSDYLPDFFSVSLTVNDFELNFIDKMALFKMSQIDRLALKGRNSSVLAMELRFSCTNPSK